ncbi:MAG: hypothetical protein AAGF60_09480 [Pseudomonadota bacterium]
MSRSAQDIYQEVLDDLTEAVTLVDYDKARPRLAIPHLMVTSTARMDVHTHERMEELLTTFGLSLRELGVTDYTRIAHDCEFLSEDVIQGYHTSHFRSGGRDIVPPYPSMCRIERRDGLWVLTSAQNAIENNKWPILLPQVRGPVPADALSATEQMIVLRDLMERVSNAFTQNDLAAWRDCVALPFTLITRHGPETFTTDAAIQADFEMYQRDIDVNGITDIIRSPISTQMVGRDRMIGVYTTHILRGNEQVVPSWRAGIILQNMDGAWRARSVLRAIGHHNWSAVSAGDIQNISKTPRNLGERLQ